MIQSFLREFNDIDGYFKELREEENLRDEIEKKREANNAECSKPNMGNHFEAVARKLKTNVVNRSNNLKIPKRVYLEDSKKKLKPNGVCHSDNSHPIKKLSDVEKAAELINIEQYELLSMKVAIIVLCIPLSTGAGITLSVLGLSGAVTLIERTTAFTMPWLFRAISTVACTSLGTLKSMQFGWQLTKCLFQILDAKKADK